MSSQEKTDCLGTGFEEFVDDVDIRIDEGRGSTIGQ